MRKYLFFILLFCSFTTYGQITAGEKAKIDELFKPWNSSTSPGASLGIVKDGKLVYSKGYGIADLEHDIPITDSTIFYIGSVSKQFVTMGILILEEQGKLSLDDRIQKYFPDFPEYDGPLTIRHFIHHTSGVRDNLTLWGLAGNDILDHIDKEEMYQLIKRQKELNFTPGENFLYSNSCYFMLGLIIEKVSEKTLQSFSQEMIFGPLGMRSTFFQDDNTRIIKNRAFSYAEEDGRFENQIMRYDLVGSGGIYSNIIDLYLWDQNFYHNKLGKGSQTLVDKMHKEGVLNNGKSIGYAFGIQNGSYRGLKTVSHGGALASYRSYILRFPDQRLSVIILGNITPIPINTLPYKIADVMLESKLAPLSFKDEVKKSLVSEIVEDEKVFFPNNVGQYSGDYYSEELDVNYRLTENEGQLFCSIKGRKPFVLEPVFYDLFNFGNLGELKFDRDSKNQIVGLSLNAGRVKNLKFNRK